jgi:oligoribonuclease
VADNSLLMFFINQVVGAFFVDRAKDRLIWIDLEMTGLNTFHDQIIEIATIVTDAKLNVLAEGPVLAIYQRDSVLEAMDEWNRKQHGSSGLLARVRASSCSCTEAEQETLAFLKRWLVAKASPMCGNSICQDRRFLARLMPELEDFFHYRNLDVSTIKELVGRWYPEATAKFQKKSSHLALDDVRDSIAELKFYREHFFVPVAHFLS